MTPFELLLHIRKIMSGWGVMFHEPEMPMHKPRRPGYDANGYSHLDEHVELRVVHRATGRRFIVAVKEG